MPDWRDEYLASLREAEQDNPVNHELIQACSQLQDRIAVLEAEKAALQETGAGAAAGAPPVPASSRRDAAAAAAAAAAGPAAASDPSVARLRLDLAEALRAQGLLQSRVKTAEGELERLRSKTADDSRAIRQLTSERNVLATKVRDRDEELRGKSKLVEVGLSCSLPSCGSIMSKTNSLPLPSSSTSRNRKRQRSRPKIRSL
ncbi:hypothetical protein RB593_002531 [Gaeumannomyces tritici]